MKRKRIILVLLTIMLCAMTVAFMTACGEKKTKVPYDYIVEFDYNVADLGDTNTKTQYLGVKSGSKLVEPGSLGDSIFQEYVINGYYSDGWYTAKLDGEGKPIVDENGRVEVDKKWNFSTDTVTGNLTLYANFRKNITLTVIVEGGENKVFDGKPGDTLSRPTRKSQIPSKDGWTFVDYYTDDTYTTKFEFPYTYTQENGECYALLIEGEWELIDTTTKFMNVMVAADINTNMYITAEELDFTGVDFVDLYKNRYFGHNLNAKIEGNGCVFKNINVQMDCMKNASYGYAFFGNIGARAEIKNITFENMSVSITPVAGVTLATDKVAFFAINIAEGAKMENVAFTNCTLERKGTVEVDMYGYCVNNAANISATIFNPDALTVTTGSAGQTE